MTAVPPPVPPEIVEKAARELYEATRELAYDDPAYDWPNIDTGYDKPDETITDPEWCRNQYRDDARAVLAAVYGDIVEAARREFAGEVLRRLGAASVEQTEGIGNPPGAIMRTTYARAARIVAGLRESETTT